MRIQLIQRPEQFFTGQRSRMAHGHQTENGCKYSKHFHVCLLSCCWDIYMTSQLHCGVWLKMCLLKRLCWFYSCFRKHSFTILKIPEQIIAYPPVDFVIVKRKNVLSTLLFIVYTGCLLVFLFLFLQVHGQSHLVKQIKWEVVPFVLGLRFCKYSVFILEYRWFSCIHSFSYSILDNLMW